MAHTKAGGSTQLGRDSRSQRLGVKLFGGQKASAGSVLVRQRGTKFRAGKNVQRGGDDTLFATISGTVQFVQRKVKRYDGSIREAKFVHVLPIKK